jgi:hypothetical protein
VAQQTMRLPLILTTCLAGIVSTNALKSLKHYKPTRTHSSPALHQHQSRDIVPGIGLDICVDVSDLHIDLGILSLLGIHLDAGLCLCLKVCRPSRRVYDLAIDHPSRIIGLECLLGGPRGRESP